MENYLLQALNEYRTPRVRIAGSEKWEVEKPGNKTLKQSGRDGKVGGISKVVIKIHGNVWLRFLLLSWFVYFIVYEIYLMAFRGGPVGRNSIAKLFVFFLFLFEKTARKSLLPFYFFPYFNQKLRKVEKFYFL